MAEPADTAQMIAELVATTPFVDTHEHLMEEARRLEARADPEGKKGPVSDIGILFSHYSDSDLVVAGMLPDDLQKVRTATMPPKEKFRLLAPHYAAARHTGYLRNVRESLRLLYGEDDLTEANCESISEKIADGVKPGFYKHILQDVANIEYCQVNNLEVPVFCETEMPELLAQDISTVPLCTGLDIVQVERLADREAYSLKDWREIIDWCFATFGPRAIATKNQCAYGRALDFAQVSEEDAAPLFERLLTKGADDLSREERKAVEDHLFHYCIDKAAEYGLPVKLHTGYYAGHGGMPLNRVRTNAGDLCPVMRAHMNAKFVLFHIDYPYQDEAIALAKHYPNAYVDMCWAWIVSPHASIRFLKEYLMAAPANKLFTFGGDYRPVEMVPGHAAIARQGLAQGITELVREKWLDIDDAPGLIDQIMRGNAHAIYDHTDTLNHWRTQKKTA
ncbi:MAG TPA: amidohydrolase family protein [Candidatus Hydrogenedentes bacterium]|nr:amidohydrolase family protein [Candidatus Hydrogenedentota bacterium]